MRRERDQMKWTAMSEEILTLNKQVCLIFNHIHLRNFAKYMFLHRSKNISWSMIKIFEESRTSAILSV